MGLKFYPNKIGLFSINSIKGYCKSKIIDVFNRKIIL